MPYFKEIFYSTNLKSKILIAISAAFLVVGNNGYNQCNLNIKNVLLSVSLFLISSVLCSVALRLSDKRTLICSALLSFGFSFIYLCFRPLYLCVSISDFFTIDRLIFFPLYFIGLAFFLTSCISILYNLLSRLPSTSCESWALFKRPLFIFLVIILAWVPCYLAYYPGIFSYDMYSQSPQAVGLIPINKHHPPLHTLFWKLCLSLENLTSASALLIYAFIQMVILAASFTYVIRYMAKRAFNNWFILLSLLFFALNPVIAIFSFITTKDVLFTAFFVCLTTELLSIYSSEKTTRRSVLRFILFSCLTCLLRNNMVYALIAAIFFTMIFVRKHRLQIGLYSLISILIFSCINGPIYSSLGIESGNSREMLSVPMQQITYVVLFKQDKLTPAEINEINKYLPTAELHQLYNPRLADFVKDKFNTEEFNKDPLAFLQLWFHLFKQYPVEYVWSFLDLNFPYWYPGAETIDPYSARKYIETYIISGEKFGYTAQRASILPSLLTYYENVAAFEFSFPFTVFFSINTPIWLLLFTILRLINQKRLSCLATLLPAFFLWCTYLLGPVSNCRYVLPLMACYPIYFMLLSSCHTKDSSTF